MKDFILNPLTIFVVCSLINVILSTLKSVWTVTASKTTAVLINTITYGFYAIVVKQLASASVLVGVLVTVATNLVGVFIAMTIIEKVKKDSLWRINATVSKNTNIIDKLKAFDISYATSEITYKDKSYLSLDIYSRNQKDSLIIKKIFEQYKIKYTITEVPKRL